MAKSLPATMIIVQKLDGSSWKFCQGQHKNIPGEKFPTLAKSRENAEEEGEAAGLGSHPIAEALRTATEQRCCSQK